MALRPTALVALALALAGCGLSDPYEQPAAEAHLLDGAVVDHRVDGPDCCDCDVEQHRDRGQPWRARRGPGPAQPRARPRRPGSAERAGRARAVHPPVHQLDRQRTTRSLAPARRARHRTSPGQALALAARAAVLARYDVTNSGTVTAIAAGQGSEQGRWAVVTNELTTGTGPYLGLPATSHVTWATVIRTRHGYVIDSWNPAS